MAKRNLLLCFDAFGTLFTPKRPVHLQYGEVARSLGIVGFTDDELATSFRTAFKDEARKHPNYGKANGLNATKWWTNIIHNTFKPFVGSDARVHDALAPRLLYRFATEEGYALHADVVALLHALPKHPQASDGRIAVGVVTNSDDRVPEVLTSLGLRVSPYRYGRALPKSPSPDELFDVDFCVMSYDVGAEKPDRAIFAAAEQMLADSPLAVGTDPASWDRVYVGDDHDKDVVGAVDAGWNAVYIDRGDKETPTADLAWLEHRTPRSLLDEFQKRKAVGVRSLDVLAQWLPRTR